MVLMSGNVSRKLSSVVSPLACIGGFRMDEGEVGHPGGELQLEVE